MGSPTHSVQPLLLLLAALLLTCLPATPGTHLLLDRPQVTANFACRAEAVQGDLPKPQCLRKLWEGPAASVPTLALSTVQLCQHDCPLCVRVHLALNATGIQGLELYFLVLNSNRSVRLQVFRRPKKRANAGTLWQVQFDCFTAESGQWVFVWLKTLPDEVLILNQSLLVIHERSGPKFHYTWMPAARAIEVSVPEGPNITVRLCHQMALECQELSPRFHQQALVSRHHPAVLPYEFLLPCLCIEASYEHQGSVRKKKCPFQDHPEAYGPELWSSMQIDDHSTSNGAQMAMSLRGRCLLHPTAALCWKESATPEATCYDIPNSTATRSQQIYTLEEVDVHPRLCFKFSYTNSSHVECPRRIDPAWNVSLSVHFLQVHMHFHSRVPASFSAALCQQQPLGQCVLEPPVYTITHPEGQGSWDLDLILPWRISRSCVLVWRSDVRFSGKQLLCPDISRKYWGLLAFGLVLLVGITLLILWGCHRFHRAIPSRGHSRPILLIYSPDSEEHKQLVCAFAALLRSALSCPVLLDLWELSHVGRLGILPWMYAQRELVSRQQGQVMVLWSAGSARAYGLWQGKARAGSRPAPEPHDLFGAAMACLQGERQGTSEAARQSDWVIAYFSKLCGRRDIPRALRYLPRYRLPQELPSLVRVLQGPSSSTPGWFRASAKALVRRLLKAEKRKGPRSQLHQPRKTATNRPAGSLFPLAHSKLFRPNCT
ncbi:interleukin-17 receptor E isoform X1 [Sphaerodactylus townsendi]|uniref:interleukin-17 receptor E isoform X1 n=1 Tax=Sphaerodactylus townsendi TaxID=933632 RepID=UPI002026F0FF|nr:interleukin-17 receptor E isoform X1 [Sphaerodactylus townsendi]